MKKIDMLKGIHKIKDISKDLDAGVARLVFDDGKELRLDFEKEDEKYFDKAKSLHQLAEKIKEKYKNKLGAEATCKNSGYENGAISVYSYNYMSFEEIGYKLGIPEQELINNNREYLGEIGYFAPYNDQNATLDPATDIQVPAYKINMPKSFLEILKELLK